MFLNLVPNSITPSFSADEARDMGVKIVIYPLVTCVPALHAIRESLATLRKTGKDDVQAKGMGAKGFFEVMGLERAVAFDGSVGGSFYGKGV